MLLVFKTCPFSKWSLFKIVIIFQTTLLFEMLPFFKRLFLFQGVPIFKLKISGKSHQFHIVKWPVFNVTFTLDQHLAAPTWDMKLIYALRQGP